jgi:hypothetical protein
MSENNRRWNTFCCQCLQLLLLLLLLQLPCCNCQPAAAVVAATHIEALHS